MCDVTLGEPEVRLEEVASEKTYSQFERPRTPFRRRLTASLVLTRSEPGVVDGDSPR